MPGGILLSEYNCRRNICLIFERLETVPGTDFAAPYRTVNLVSLACG